MFSKSHPLVLLAAILGSRNEATLDFATMQHIRNKGIAEKQDDWELCSQSSRPVFIPRISNAGIKDRSLRL